MKNVLLHKKKEEVCRIQLYIPARIFTVKEGNIEFI